METEPEVIEPRKDGGLTAWLGNAPWWLLSAGIHLVVILGATLIYVERVIAVEHGEIICGLQSPRQETVIPTEDVSRDVTEKSLPSLDPNQPSVNDEPVLFFPEAEISDHNESDDGMDDNTCKGDSLKFLARTPGNGFGIRGTGAGENPGAYDVMGTGGGNGSTGKWGYPDRGGHKNLVKGKGGSQATEDAVLAALRWLARHQNPDGSWSAARFSSTCGGTRCSGDGASEFDVGVTGLSLLAFLGAGYTQLSKDRYVDPAAPGRVLDFGKVTKNALQWLAAQQDAEGCVGPRGSRYMYNHAVAALALSEGYGMSVSPVLKEPAQRAIDFLVAAQNPGKGWRYTARCGDNDTSVTGWAVMALKSAEASELSFPRSAYEGALAWIDEATEKDYYGVGYIDDKPHRKVIVQGRNEAWDHHYSMTAVGILSRIFISREADAKVSTPAKYLLDDLPAYKQGKVDFYYWYYASLALFQYGARNPIAWTKWNEPMKNALVPNQKNTKDGCANGSWSPEDDRWGFEGGRVYATAINALTLEVYYRYKNVFGAAAK